MQGKSDKIHEHPHSLCEACTISYRENILTGIGRDFCGILGEPFLSWGRSWTVFFLFIVRLLGIFELFFIKLLRPVDFYFYFLFTSCSSLVWGQFSIKLNISISNLFTSHLTIVQSLLFLCHQYLLKSLSKDSNSVFPPNLNRKNWAPNDSFWARSPNFSPRIQALRLVNALSKLAVFVFWTPPVTTKNQPITFYHTRLQHKIPNKKNTNCQYFE
jgi:hypothetical protein